MAGSTTHSWIEKGIAVAIVRAAVEGGFEDQPVPDDDGALVERAEYWVTEAQKVEGTDIPAVNAILSLARGEGVPEPAAPPDAETPPPSGASDAAGQPGPQEAPPPSSPASGARDNLPVPAEIEGEAVEMPFDLTGLDDRKIRYLHGAHNAYLSRVTWLLSQEQVELANMETLLKHAQEKARRGVSKMDLETGKAKLSADIDSEVAEDDDVKKYAQLVEERKAQITKYRALADIYSGNVKTLSREWSMRTEEWQRGSGAKT